MTEHKLVDGTLHLERDDKGEAKGIIGRCACGWTTGYRFSSFAASASFQDHIEESQKGNNDEGR